MGTVFAEISFGMREGNHPPISFQVGVDSIAKMVEDGLNLLCLLGSLGL